LEVKGVIVPPLIVSQALVGLPMVREFGTQIIARVCKEEIGKPQPNFSRILIGVDAALHQRS
jgi:hypothetical protein